MNTKRLKQKLYLALLLLSLLCCSVPASATTIKYGLAENGTVTNTSNISHAITVKSNSATDINDDTTRHISGNRNKTRNRIAERRRRRQEERERRRKLRQNNRQSKRKLP